MYYLISIFLKSWPTLLNMASRDTKKWHAIWIANTDKPRLNVGYSTLSFIKRTVAIVEIEIMDAHYVTKIAGIISVDCWFNWNVGYYTRHRMLFQTALFLEYFFYLKMVSSSSHLFIMSTVVTVGRINIISHPYPHSWKKYSVVNT